MAKFLCKLYIFQVQVYAKLLVQLSPLVFILRTVARKAKLFGLHFYKFKTNLNSSSITVVMFEKHMDFDLMFN